MTDDRPEEYDELVERVKKISNVGNAASVLQWDQEVMMPEGGTQARSQQLSALSSVRHDLLTKDEVGELLDSLRDSSLGDEERAVVREVRREYERADRVPNDLVERISRTTSEALPVWKEAKTEGDFSKFEPKLDTLVELRRDYAEHIDPDRSPYAVLFEEFEPYLGIDTAERILERLRDELVPMVEEIRRSDAEVGNRLPDRKYDEEAQKRLVREALDSLGYDWDRGRLDTAPHPFSTGTQFDARVATRYDEDNPLEALTSTVHEFGHALYTLGLPKEGYGTPLGESRNLSVHESQSRLWENHVARSRDFWDFFLPTFEEHLGIDGALDVDDIYETANQVYEDNTVRVEADELTYHMHIVLRFEIERDLISGDLEADEVPGVWNDKTEEYLGVRPDGDDEGCLQDIHWSHASFGYFPTYTLGSVLAAQIYAAAEDEIENLGSKVSNGRFEELRDWLRENVHRHGKRYTTDDLIAEATDEEPTADYFLDYVEEKYGELYGI